VVDGCLLGMGVVENARVSFFGSTIRIVCHLFISS
jgi:hypothetical protein